MLLNIERDETGFEGLTEKGAAGGGGPIDARFGGGDLNFGGIWDRLEEVEKLTDWNDS